MANLTYTDNGITFGNIKKVLHESGGVAGKENYTVSGSPADPLTGGIIDKAIPSFNCVDIDWNGANLKGFTWGNNTIDVSINTTGELLKYIEKAYYQAYTGTGNSSESISYNQISLKGLNIIDENNESKSLNNFGDLIYYTEKALQQAYFSENSSHNYNFNFLFAPRVFAGNTSSYSLLDTSNDTQLITGSTFMDKEKISIIESNHVYNDIETNNERWVNVLDINVEDNGINTNIKVNSQVFDLRIIDLNDPLLSSEYFAVPRIDSVTCTVTGSKTNGEAIAPLSSTYYANSDNPNYLLSNIFRVRDGVGLIEHNVQNIFIGSIENNLVNNYPANFKTIDDLGTKILATSVSYYTSNDESTKWFELSNTPKNEIRNLEVSLTAEGFIHIYKGNKYVNKYDSIIHSIPFSIKLNSGNISVTTPDTSNTPSREKRITIVWPVTSSSSGELEYFEDSVVDPGSHNKQSLLMAISSKYMNLYGKDLTTVTNFDDMLLTGMAFNDDGSIAYYGDTHKIKFVNSALESTNDSTTPIVDSTTPVVPDTSVVPDSTLPKPT